jgi:hypothetical protein
VVVAVLIRLLSAPVLSRAISSQPAKQVPIQYAAAPARITHTGRNPARRRRDGEMLELVEHVVDGVVRDVSADDRASGPRGVRDAHLRGARHRVQSLGDPRHDFGLSEYLEVDHATPRRLQAWRTEVSSAR